MGIENKLLRPYFDEVKGVSLPLMGIENKLLRPYFDEVKGVSLPLMGIENLVVGGGELL